MEGFDIEVSQNGVGAIVTLRGELDLATAPRLREEFIALADRGVCAVTVDMADLDFIDSTGLNVLVAAVKRLRELGGDMALRSPSPRTLKVFEITGLTQVFAIT